MRCKRCGDRMLNIMHFEKNKNYAFHMCKRCKQPTHQKRVHFEELTENNEKKCFHTYSKTN